MVVTAHTRFPEAELSLKLPRKGKRHHYDLDAPTAGMAARRPDDPMVRGQQRRARFPGQSLTWDSSTDSYG